VIVRLGITTHMKRTGRDDRREGAVVLLWVVIVAIVVVLLGGAAAAMAWDPNSRREARAADDGAAMPLSSVRSPHDNWPRRSRGGARQMPTLRDAYHARDAYAQLRAAAGCYQPLDQPHCRLR